ncbi:hypothetical protein FIBSPDRAFT_1040857 [Athelia psychrophila]|uniref:DUF6534 domain-containing protein n=1 Tax=Athelia psychrophila TaxID=1759441 RepID=A0A166PPN0_9AGAM|nr:hypothetical protein FIBSPDRAFT_1040857 [Fibularhizoctonia sp. CBS 109695]
MTSPISDWGAILIGCFIGLILFGVVAAQAFSYIQDCENDPLWQKLFIASLMTLVIISTIFSMIWTYQLFIDGWGDPAAFVTAGWPLVVQPMLEGTIAAMVQLFFAWRLHIIAKRPWLTSAIVSGAFLTFCGGVGTSAATGWLQQYALLGESKAIACIWDFSAVVTDITITVALTVHLRRHRGEYEVMNLMLNRIIQLTLQNGFLTTVVTFVANVLYLSTPKPYYITGGLILPKLYINSALSTLVARKRLRTPVNTTLDAVSRSRSLVESKIVGSTSRFSQTAPRRPEVFVEIHEMVDTDGAMADIKQSHC